MIAPRIVSHEPASIVTQKLFLAMLPTIVKYAQFAFRDFDPDAREDGVAEVVANSFVAFSRLIERGKADLAYPTVLARYAIAQFHAGRRTGAKMNSREIYCRLEQSKAGFDLLHLGSPGEQRGGWKETLVENRRTTPADLAAFKIDAAEWFDALPRFKRRIAEALALGERTKDVASENGVSPGRISQLRRELEDSWREFVGDAV